MAAQDWRKQAPSTLGRLLEEISWEGDAGIYRKGGRGRENVLTAEVFQALDFLPRVSFLGRVLGSCQGASETVALLRHEIEHAEITFLPADVYLAKKPALCVQPDVKIDSPSVCCLVEAKRIRPGRFQREQLARELVSALQVAAASQKPARPLLLLVLPSNPPVWVERHGKLELPEAIGRWLPSVLGRCDQIVGSADDLTAAIDACVTYTTWSRLAEDVSLAAKQFSATTDECAGSVRRLAGNLLNAVKWHS